MTQFTQLSRLHPEAKIHFSGIGGIGMSGLAEIMHNFGYSVQGSDLLQNYNTKRLEAAGIKVFAGHNHSNLKSVSFLVKSSAIKKSNSELEYCEKNDIPVVTRAELLSEIMRSYVSISVSGAHGKTTTTSLIASILERAGLDPTVIVGGIMQDKNTNVRIGKSDFMVVEADESDGTFTEIPSTIAVVTNIDKEHLDHYRTFDQIKKEFYKFISKIAFYGFAVVCIDDKHVHKLAKQIKNREIITYGIKQKEADITAINIKMFADHSIFDVTLPKKFGGKISGIKLGIPGMHSVLNALAGIAVAVRLGVNHERLKAALQSFGNVKRRFTLTQEVNGIKFIDDYSHHPSEIIAAINIAKQVVSGTGGKIMAIFQPHRYTRVQSLFKEFTKCFNDADIVYISDIYSAQEAPIPGITSEALASAMKKLYKRKHIATFISWEILPVEIKKQCKKNDLVLFLGAGNITEWAYKVPQIVAGNTDVSHE